MIKKAISAAGFSIIEMMVALSIMSMAGAAITLGMRAVQKSAMNSGNAMNVQITASGALGKISRRHQLVGGIPAITGCTVRALPGGGPTGGAPVFPTVAGVLDVNAMVIGFSGSNNECDFNGNNLNTLVIASTCEVAPVIASGSEPINQYPDLTQIPGCRAALDLCKFAPGSASPGRPVVTMSSTIMVDDPANPGTPIKQIQPATRWPQPSDKSIWGAYACAENVMNTFDNTLVKSEYLGTNLVLIVGYRHYQGGKVRIIWQAHPTFLSGGEANAKAANIIKPP